MGRPQLTVGVGILAFLIAVVLGGAHAVAPGHGKTIMAAYLVGSRGRLTQALTVAGTVAVTHTVGVLTLGVVLATSLQLAPAALYEWLRLTSGILVTLVGAHLLHRAVRSLRTRSSTGHTHPPAARDHSHDDRPAAPHDHHDHHHDHDHVGDGHRGHQQDLVPVGHGEHAHRARAADTHPEQHHHAPGGGHRHATRIGAAEPLVHTHGGRPHTHHLPAPDAPLSVRSLLAMGFAGGLSPSPSAVVVLLGAAALGRAWYGVLLVLAYGIGLAASLTGIGFALARWGDRLHRAAPGRWSRRLMPRLPAATAATIVAVGLGMVAFAATDLWRR